MTLDAGEGSFSVPRAAVVREFRAGPLVARDGAALVIDLSTFARSVGVRIDGVLPAQMFGGLLTLDHCRGDATVTAGELPPADGREVIELQFGDRAFVTMDVGGRPCPFLIDTGKDGFLAMPAAAETVLRFHAPPAVVGRFATMAGITPRRAARVHGPLQWGACRVADPVVSLSAAGYGLVGIEFLREFRTTFDFTNHRVRFERAGDEPICSPPLRSPGAGFLHEDGAWTVGYVLDGGPAERAGLRVGDRVEAIDGRPVREVGNAEYEKLLATRASMSLRVVRAGAASDVAVAITTLVE
jgi:hypothetical protein